MSEPGLIGVTSEMMTAVEVIRSAQEAKCPYRRFFQAYLGYRDRMDLIRQAAEGYLSSGEEDPSTVSANMEAESFRAWHELEGAYFASLRLLADHDPAAKLRGECDVEA
jgi:hypothetical protein